jgi:hypothetical protein
MCRIETIDPSRDKTVAIEEVLGAAAQDLALVSPQQRRRAKSEQRSSKKMLL